MRRSLESAKGPIAGRQLVAGDDARIGVDRECMSAIDRRSWVASDHGLTVPESFLIGMSFRYS